ncbi:MAG: hypothetical protein LBT89_04515 [Planctomycetaceae bacterium]|nr:hypothetical protein [Planctomycetaceae bacterium]
MLNTKSPDDRFTIWDYHKTQCYSRLYASQHKISVDGMLRTRFQTVPNTVQESIKSYTDLIVLDSLLEAAVTCESISCGRNLSVLYATAK